MDGYGQLRSFPSGIYHAVPAGETSWYGLACLAVQASIDSGVPMKALPAAIKPIPAMEYPLPAPRPMNSRMSTQKLQKTLDDLDGLGNSGSMSKFPQWDQQVRAYVAELAKNQLI
jgi:dTDP-4-dehydrorhamnose reductase